MPRIVIAHAVQDVDRWLKGNAERAAAFAAAMHGGNGAVIRQEPWCVAVTAVPSGSLNSFCGAKMVPFCLPRSV